MSDVETTREYDPAEPGVLYARPILAERVGWLEAQVKSLSRRAVKLGVGRVELTLAGDEYPVRVGSTWDEQTASQVAKFEGYRNIVLEGEMPTLPGWSLVGVLDHEVPDGELPMFSRVPGNEIPVPRDLQTSGNRCDHCGTSRHRSETFVLTNEDGRLTQVGRNCLRDHLGVDPARLVWAALFAKVIEGCGDDEGRAHGSHENWIEAETLLAEVARVIRTEGWLSRGKAREQDRAGCATVDRALGDMIDRRNGKTRFRSIPSPEAEDHELAAKALAWARAISEDEQDEYLERLGRLSRWPATNLRYAGLLGSAVAAYQRAMGVVERKRLEREALAALGEPRYIGTAGARIKAKKATKRTPGQAGPGRARVLYASTFEGAYGVTGIHKFVILDGEHQGARLLHFGTPLGLSIGEEVQIEALTIKRHEPDRKTGEPVNLVSRIVLGAEARS